MKLTITIICVCFLTLLGVAQTPLEEFKKIDSALQQSNQSIQQSGQTLLQALRRKDSIKINTLSAAQSTAYKAFEKLTGQINGLKNALSKKKDDDLKYPKQLFFTKGEAKKLYAMLQDYERKTLAALPDSALKNKAKNYLQLDVSSFTKKSWPDYYFGNLPVFAAITILNKIENDVANCMMIILQLKKS